MDTGYTLLRAFLAGEIDSRGFHHADHVRAGFELLRHHSFPDAAAQYCAALKALCARAGNPEAYHETMTLAFLSLLAERSASYTHGDFAGFAAANPDLLDKSVLARWYSPERLASPLARRTFLLPEAPR